MKCPSKKVIKKTRENIDEKYYECESCKLKF